LEKIGKEELEDFQEKIYNRGKELSDKERSGKRPPKYGLCSTCCHFHYGRTLYDNEWAICSKYKSHVPSTDRIVECSDYYPFNQPDLYDMAKDAYLIEAKTNRKIGFLP